MIKALILDVDGVIVGNKEGTNFPLPHSKIIQVFKKLNTQGLPIILCTAKFRYAIEEIISQAELHNPHITDGGALVIDPVDNILIKKHVIDPSVVQSCLDSFLKRGLFVEIYTAESYYHQASQMQEFAELTQKRIQILQMDPIIVDSLKDAAKNLEVIKVINFVKETDKAKVDEVVREIGGHVNTIWTSHPYLKPYRPLVITAPGVTKAQGSKEALDSLSITFDEVLGVGDSASDWDFMQHCGYVATLANGDEKIKELVKEKESDRCFIAPHVNDNGMLDILRHFSLL
jgi:hydroxymethylpyrimidine pyrophosphatase-like HAD family hydrolase